jgi:hypothetical protein
LLPKSYVETAENVSNKKAAEVAAFQKFRLVAGTGFEPATFGYEDCEQRRGK